MSKGRELTLLEKWADAATASIPPLSPTSPKATKFCCCPNRRQYHIKQPKKSTLDAKNIFLDNNFSYIDDVPSSKLQSNTLKTNTNSNSHNNENPSRNVAGPASPCDYDDILDYADKDSKSLARTQADGIAQPWQHDKGCHLAGSNKQTNEQYSNSKSNSNCHCLEEESKENTKTIKTAIGNNCNSITNNKLASDNDSVGQKTIKQQQQQQLQHQNASNEASNDYRKNIKINNNNNNSDQQFQRLSNSEFNCSNNKQQQQREFRNNNTNKNSHNITSTTTCNCALDSSNKSTNINNNAATHKCCNNTSESHCNNNGDGSDVVDSVGDKIDLQNKMTITTTNAASRKRGECGLTSSPPTATATGTAETASAAATGQATAMMTMPTTQATATATMTTKSTSSSPTPITPMVNVAATTPTSNTTPKTSRPTTPSLTTVIKTTLVKRSPSNESTRPTSAPTTPLASPAAQDANKTIVAAILSKYKGPTENVWHNGNNNNNQNKNNCDDEKSEITTRSVKERIAAFAAGNEQAKSHDNSIKTAAKTPSNSKTSRHQSNMTTQATSAINTLHYNHPPLISSSKCSTVTTTTTATITPKTTTTTTATPSATSSKNNDQEQHLPQALERQKTPSSDAPQPQRTSLPTLTAATGYATMPRRRSPGERHSSAVRCGSITAAMTADKKFLANDGGETAKLSNGDNTNGASGSCRKLVSTLDNLDLALTRDLTDDDGEDSYSAFQEYLERVEHEINEVFEMRKAQKLLQQQQQQQLQQEAESLALAPPPTICIDELSRSTESDSGCGSSNDTSSSTGPTTTKLKALPPPPLNPIESEPASSSSAASTLKRRQHVQHDNSHSNEVNNEDVNVWANKFLRDLDNLMSSTRPLSLSACSSPTSKTSPLLLSAAATAAILSRYGKGAGAATTAEREAATNGLVLRPEKHTTIPLQSFNLDCGHLDNVDGSNSSTTSSSSSSSSSSNNNDSPSNTTKSTVAYLRTLSAPNAYHQQQQQQLSLFDNKPSERSLAAFNATMPQHQPPHYHNLTNLQHRDAAATASTILKIEETGATSGKRQPHDIDEQEQALKSRRQRQLDNELEITTMRSNATRLSPSQSQSYASCRSNGGDKNMWPAVAANSSMATSLPKRDRINHATPATVAATATAKMLSTTATNNAAVLSPSTLLNSSSKANGGATATTTPANSLLLNGSDATKKGGSTSTIWTSEESILRSVGAVDEDNNSTSSSACEEASGVLSSGKSGISLDSSGLDNDNNESGIGTATPPKDIPYWKAMHNDAESVSSFDAVRKMKFQKSSSVASSDDPDLLEVLSLCDEPHGEGDVTDDHVDESQHDEIDERQQVAINATQPLSNAKQPQKPMARLSRHRPRLRQRPTDSRLVGVGTGIGVGGEADDIDLDEEDEGHDEFETIPFYDCECNDGDASSASGSGNGGGRSGSNATSETNAVLLRRKLNGGAPICAPPKCRSHSLDTTTLPSAYYQHYAHQHAASPLTRKLHHLQHRTKERGQLSLALRQEPFTSLLSPTQFNELPSPSSASLHGGHDTLGIQELTTKSNSAPLLLKQEKKRDDFAGQKSALRHSRSQSDRYLAEIEALESCKWLRAAGFPQYAQMYEDHQFPIDLASVAKDHTNLENDQLQSLYRRLCILNRCANMRIDQSHKPQTPQKEDSDDENFALSENWTFQPHIRRWSRIGEMGLELPPGGLLNIEKTESSSKESSPDRFDDNPYDTTGLTLNLMSDSADNSTLNDSGDAGGVRLRRTGSERFKDGAKAFLRRVESIKSRRRKRQNREGMVISGPQALDLSQLGQRSSMRKPEAVYSTPPSPSAVSPMHTFPKGPLFGNELKVPSQSENFLSPNRASPKRTPTTPRSMRTSPLHFFSNAMPHLREGKSDDSSSYYSDSQESSAGGKLALRKTPSKTRRFLQRTGKVDDIGAHSDSECHQGRKLLIKDANSNTTEVSKVKIKKLTRGGSLNLGKDPKKRDGFRTASFRSRSTSRKETKTEETDNFKRTPVVRWHSFQMEERPHMIFRKCFSNKIDPNSKDQGLLFAAMSVGQLQILRKLALVILTGHMENFCPSHRSGWNWELPKFIKKIKMPDYKDKKVFGVPLMLVLQRTGQALPVSIRAAFRWLQVRALDQIGLFRKSGVKSRITKLKSEIEQLDSTSQCMELFDTQQAYDVADMLKQYFRDLPECLLTTKMSETFATIFQHLPKEVRLEAVQCAVLLLPDENREILYSLLEFLTLVAANAEFNQMNANNLAVCLAPSLFHSSISTGVSSVSASPRRRKGAGVPDEKELQEAKASHECLAFMIDNYKQIFTATKEKISRCNFGYMEESKPVPLEALGEGMQFHNWRGYLYECTSHTIKEGREKTRGWFTVTSLVDNNVDIAYKKVGDGHPLRLWRCITEVEGPPKEVLDYIIKQRASWDPNLLESQTVKKLDERTEIFQYAIDGQFTTDFCVLRYWQTDLPRGACVIVETSIDYGKAKPMFGAIRGVVLASRYLIEPCGSGRSRVMHLARVDIKGRSPEWYNRCFGHICSHYLSRIRLAFKNVADGPESKV